MKRVLLVSPHFPPDPGAATHRVRLLAPHLEAFGWSPTVVTIDPRDYEGHVDPELEAMVPRSLRVIRARAWSPRWTRLLGFGDLGLRAFRGLHVLCERLLREESFDVLFVTIFPTYPALLGPLLKRRHPIPFVLDYIDPWVGEWGLSVGGGKNTAPDLKSRLSRRLSVALEPMAVRAADGLTAVSEGILRDVLARNPEANGVPTAEIPYGGEEADFEYLRSRGHGPLPAEGETTPCFKLCYMGTLLPLGRETLRAFLAALSRLKSSSPRDYDRLRVEFVGTSNQTFGELAPVVLPEAERAGVADVIHEIPERIDYLGALSKLVAADAILLMGSSESRYTASKLYPALLARRPLLAIHHADSTVVSILNRAVRPPTARIVTYDDSARAETRVEQIERYLLALMREPRFDNACVDFDVVEQYSAKSMAGQLARLFDTVSR